MTGEGEADDRSRVLKGLKCSQCGRITTVFALACSSCGSANLSNVVLSGRGKIRSFTVLNVPSETFASHAPYAYAVIELEEGCGISGWMPDITSPSDLAPGDKVRFEGFRGKASVFRKCTT